MTLTLLVEQINTYCAQGRWFWVAGLARETWPVLRHHLPALHPVAQEAVEHYASEEGGTR